jgi:hypothetical protein
LRDILKFEIDHNLYDVALTMFFRPDATPAGGATVMLLFLQNHASRSRRVQVKVRKAAELGDLSGRLLRLRLAPGEAAVYRHSFVVPRNATPKRIFAACPVKIKFLSGEGNRLIRSEFWKQHTQVTRVRHVGAGLDVLPIDHSQPPPLSVPQPQFLSLYSPAVNEPTWTILEQLTRAPAWQEIAI